MRRKAIIFRNRKHTHITMIKSTKLIVYHLISAGRGNSLNNKKKMGTK